MEAASRKPFAMDLQWPELNNSYLQAPFQVSGLSIDKNGSMLALTRGDNDWFPQTGFKRELIPCDPVLVLEPQSGRISSTWGSNIFVMPHQIRVDKQGNVWVVDCGADKVLKFDQEFQLLMEVGSETVGFRMPTDIAIADDGSFVVSDGYGNARVVHFDPTGKIITAWGTKGTAPLAFRVPHSLVLGYDGNIYIADRDNDRIQILDQQGKLLGIWSHVERPSTLCIAGGCLFVLSNLAAEKGTVMQLDLLTGAVINSFPTMPPDVNGDFEWPHAMAVQEDGKTVYIGYTLTGKRIQRFVQG